MSGIFGFVQNCNKLLKSIIDLNQIKAWNHIYGKDAEDIISGKYFGLGCCKKNLSKYSTFSAPIFLNGEDYVVIDAIIYNRDYIIDQCGIQDVVSDEVLLYNYIKKFGYDALKDVNGDFCGAVFNKSNNSIVLFRDHMGIRPLFYYATNELIVFSTDIRGIITLPQVDASISEDWIYKTLMGYSTLSLTNTEYTNIFTVEPATYITFLHTNERNYSTTKKYWQLGKSKIRLSSEKEYINHLRSIVTDAVKVRLNAIDGLVGAELSGGIDSGVIDILINRMGRDCIYHSWSLNPSELPYVDNDERQLIIDICKQENITCNFSKRKIDLIDSEVSSALQQLNIVFDDVPSALRYVFPPYSNTLNIFESSSFISKKGGKVIFSGHGGDEGISHRCGPYEMFYHHEYYRFFRYMWSTTHRQKHRITNTIKNSIYILGKVRKELRKPCRFITETHDIINTNFCNRFNKSKMPLLTFEYDPKQYINIGGSRNRLDNVALYGAYCDIQYLLPYLDYRVVDFSVSIPRYLYLKGYRDRYIFREAFKDIMPKSLYRHNVKEETSFKSIKNKEDYYETFSKNIIGILSKMNRDYWGEYVNFEVIDAWISKGKPTDEDYFHSLCIINNLCQLTMASNVVEKAREIIL